MNNTRRLVLQNTHIAHEWYLHGHISDNTEYTRTEAMKGFRRKAKSDETKAREAAERRYTSRSNICDVCHMTKAAGTNECGC